MINEGYQQSYESRQVQHGMETVLEWDAKSEVLRGLSFEKLLIIKITTNGQGLI